MQNVPERQITRTISVKRQGDHYEIQINGEFYCSADTLTEASEEVREYLRQEEN